MTEINNSGGQHGQMGYNTGTCKKLVVENVFKSDVSTYDGNTIQGDAI